MATDKHEEARAFLSDLYGRKEPAELLIQIWGKERKASAYIADPLAAADFAVDSVQRDAYVAVSLVTKDLGKKRRGTAKDAVCIPGFWIDIDVNGGPDEKKNAAPDLDAAFELAGAVLQPTIVVASGYGLQAWYLFEEPWSFHTQGERSRAAQLSAGWVARMRKEAQARGFTIDAVQDLARLMRVPGTINAKGGLSAPVVGYGAPVHEQDGPRYPLETLAEQAESVPVPNAGSNGSVDVTIDGKNAPPWEMLEVLRETNPRFKDTWERKRQDHREWSPSEYCQSVASFCAHAGFSDQEIADTLVAYRTKNNDTEKHDGFYAATIATARITARDDKRNEDRQIAVEKLAQIGEAEKADPDTIASLFSEVIGGGFKVKELVKSNSDPKTAIYRLIMDDGSIVEIGSFDNLDDPNRFAKQFGVTKDYRPPLVKKGDWIKALNGLLKMVVVRDSEMTEFSSQVLAALRQYVDATITPDHNEAAQRRDPFERKGHIWIAPKQFYDYAKRQLRMQWSFPDVEEVLDRLGFEKKAKNFHDPETDSGQNTTRDYYRAPLLVLDEAPHVGDADDS